MMNGAALALPPNPLPEGEEFHGLWRAVTLREPVHNAVSVNLRKAGSK
jgi:hypothetical protein